MHILEDSIPQERMNTEHMINYLISHLTQNFYVLTPPFMAGMEQIKTT
jgi:hypothetical protein